MPRLPDENEGDSDDRWRDGNRTGPACTSRQSGRKIRGIVADVGHEGDAYSTDAVKRFPADVETQTRRAPAVNRSTIANRPPRSEGTADPT